MASEATLSSVTGTRTIDVDGAALLATRELIFSFADNESTVTRGKTSGGVRERSPVEGVGTG